MKYELSFYDYDNDDVLIERLFSIIHLWMIMTCCERFPHNMGILSWKDILIFQSMSYPMNDVGLNVYTFFHTNELKQWNVKYSVENNAKHRVDIDWDGNSYVSWGGVSISNLCIP